MSLQLVPFAQLPPEERPREKLALYGVEALNDIELLAILLNTGYKKMGVKELAAHLLNEFGSKGIFQFSKLEELKAQTGLPFVKSCQLLAMAEYVRRVSKKDSTKIKSSEQLYDYVKDALLKTSFERLMIVCVDSERRVLYSGTVAQGKENTLQVSLAGVFHHPIRLNTAHFYLAHNHPEGITKPSKEDIAFTLAVKEASQQHGLFLDDHIIIAEEGFYSFSLQGVL